MIKFSNLQLFGAVLLLAQPVFAAQAIEEEVENHLLIKDTAEEKIKARRIMERIKQLSEYLELFGENRRK